ncbi:NAD(P)H-dependent oxidoreductase [Proteobacteria bacterium 005FR1]|nr:NAD(P)H-dependent oxidoreductase [Proteobacteria bacterium 005FR1]
MLKLHTIVTSTRPGRVGLPVGAWFHGFASARGAFDCRLVDLAEFDLPVYDEPEHPRLRKYTKAHTHAWSRSVAEADAYVFVIPEYNHFAPPSLVNALDFVYQEWNYKPCGFVSYGGVSGGIRSAQAVKLQVTTLKMMPMVEGVMIQMPWKRTDENGAFESDESIDNSAVAMLDELHKWAQALKVMR